MNDRSDARALGSRMDHALKQLRYISALLLLAAAISGCSTKSVGWTEEVQLSDGRTIQVKRAATYKDMTPLGGPFTALVQRASVRIKSDGFATTEWSDQLIPIFLDVDPVTREFVLVCTYDDGEVWRARGQPRPQYWQFRLREDRWVPEPVSAFVWERRTNLVIDPFWVDTPSKLVTLTKKREWRDRYPLARSFRTVDPGVRPGE